MRRPCSLALILFYPPFPGCWEEVGMGFHSVLAYFTGYKYEPDPEIVQPEPETGRPIHPEMTSIVETIVREKAEQEPEDQAATAEGDVTFSDLMQQYEAPGTAEAPPPLPSILDAPGASEDPGAMLDTPQDRLVQDDSGLDEGDVAEPGDVGEPGEGTVDESDAWLSEMGLGQGDMSLERSLQGQPDGADRLGLDDMFGQGEADMPAGQAEDAAGMFGDEPGYEDLVGEALGDGESDGEGWPDLPDEMPDEGEPQLFNTMEDPVLVDAEDIGHTESGDRGFAKSVLLADERMAESVVRKVLASDVTININVGEGEAGEEDELGGLEDELGEGLEGAADELGQARRSHSSCSIRRARSSSAEAWRAACTRCCCSRPLRSGRIALRGRLRRSHGATSRSASSWAWPCWHASRPACSWSCSAPWPSRRHGAACSRSVPSLRSCSAPRSSSCPI